jgi:hypothetical protein
LPPIDFQPEGEHAVMNEPQAASPRRRLQELQAIPDSKRTEAEWEELNELEISLASVNQYVEGDKGGARPNGSPAAGGESRSSRGSKGRKPAMRSQRRPPRVPGPS